MGWRSGPWSGSTGLLQVRPRSPGPARSGLTWWAWKPASARSELGSAPTGSDPRAGGCSLSDKARKEHQSLILLSLFVCWWIFNDAWLNDLRKKFRVLIHAKIHSKEVLNRPDHSKQVPFYSPLSLTRYDGVVFFNLTRKDRGIV